MYKEGRTSLWDDTRVCMCVCVVERRIEEQKKRVEAKIKVVRSRGWDEERYREATHYVPYIASEIRTGKRADHGVTYRSVFVEWGWGGVKEALREKATTVSLNAAVDHKH